MVNNVRLVLQNRILGLMFHIVQICQHLSYFYIGVDFPRRFDRLIVKMRCVLVDDALVEDLLFDLQVVLCHRAPQRGQPKLVVSPLALAFYQADNVQTMSVIQLIIAEIERFNAGSKARLLGILLQLFLLRFLVLFIHSSWLVVVLEWFFGFFLVDRSHGRPRIVMAQTKTTPTCSSLLLLLL